VQIISKLARTGIVGLALLLLAGCASAIPIREEPAAVATQSGGTVTISEANSGSDVSIEAGQKLIVSLQSNPSTGYSWFVSQVDSGLLRQTSGRSVRKKSKTPKQMVGAPGREVFTFSAEAAGITPLEMEYRRPWEKNVAPARTFSVQVIVR
jgi:inhibitor of cysteine peptidase